MACSLLLASLVIGVLVGLAAKAFEGDGAADNGLPSFSTVAAVKPDGGTVGADLPYDLSNPETDYGFDTDFEGESEGYKALFSASQIGGSVPKPSEDRVIMTAQPDDDESKEPEPSQGSTSTSPDDSNGNSSSGSAHIETGTLTTTEFVSNSGLANAIKSHTYSTGLDIFQSARGDIPTDTTALMNAIHSGSNSCSFIAVRISDGATIAYNANALYKCASSYKAVATLYAYKQAEAGVFNLNTPITYTSADYYPGSGIIKSSRVGSVYTMKNVADYSIVYSDNTAYTMLQRCINKNDIIAFGRSLGCPNYANFESNWPNISAIDEAMWWAEIYNYASSGSAYANQLYNVFLSATNPVIKKALGDVHQVAHKSGSISFYFHDAGIVHSEDPYLLVLLTHNPYNYSSRNESYFYPVVREIDKLINP